MKTKTESWLKKPDKKSPVSLSFKRLNLSLGEYLSTINSLKCEDKEVKETAR